jgi:two-component system nitrate/nitrite response regulator NarL
MTMRVLLIDDHALFRAGLQGLLEQRSIKVVAAVGDGTEGLRLARELAPDVILLDLRMPEVSGLEVLHRLRADGMEMPVVVLTTSNEESDLVASLRNGAQGYLLKDMDPDELVGALRDIVAGKNVVAHHLTDMLARVIQGGGSSAPAGRPNPFMELTPREREILQLLAEGQSNKMIARNLDISDGTVKLHVKSILRKLGVHSRVEAAVMAVEHGIPHND